MRNVVFSLLLSFTLLCSLSTVGQEYDWVPTLDEFIENNQLQSARSEIDSMISLNPGVAEQSYLYRYLGDIFYADKKYQQSLENYLLALIYQEKRELPDAGFVVLVHNYLGELYMLRGLPEKALSHYSTALEMMDISNDSTSYIDCIAGIGGANAYMGNYYEALKYYQMSFDFNRARRDSLGVSYDLNDIAFIYSNIGDLDKSIQYYRESLLFLDSAKHPMSYARKLNNLGMTYLRKGPDFADAAEMLINKSYLIYKALDDPTNIAKRLINLSLIDQARNELIKAEDKLKEAISLADLSGMTKISIYNTWADLAYKKNQYTKVNQLTDSAINLARDLKIYPHMQKPLQLKRDVAINQGNYQRAYEYHVQFQQVKDSVEHRQNLEKAQNLVNEYELHKKEVEIELLSARNDLNIANLKSQRTQKWLFMVISAIVIIAATFIIYLQWQKYNLRNQLLSKEIDELRWKINALVDGDPRNLNISLDEINTKLENALTEKEFRIFELALTEMNNKQIAEEVVVSVNTVKYHLKNIYEKLGVSNRNEVIQFLVKSS